MLYNPYPYQAYCINRVISDSTLGLFLGCGLGKTAITLTAVNDLIYNRFAVSKVLVIAPKKVAESTWSNEAAKWDHLKHLRISKIMGTAKQRLNALYTSADIYVTNRDNVTWLVETLQNQWPFDMVVIDELSSFKAGKKAQRFKSLCYVRPHINRIVGLTGTPVANKLVDIWAQIYLLDGGVRLGKTVTQFRTVYTDAQTHGGHFTTYMDKPGAFESITNKISDICVSMSAEDYLSLPELVTVDVPVELDGKAKAGYETFEHDAVLQIMSQELTAGCAAVLSGKLLQYTNGAVYNTDKQAIEIHKCKIEAFTELVESLQGEHAIVFYSFRHDIGRLKDSLKAFPDLRVRELKSPIDEVDWNAGKIDILLAHPASAAYGLNLQDGGNHIIMFGLNWSRELYEQSIARLHRQGQKSTVFVHRLYCPDTRDEDVIKALDDKGDFQAAFLKSLKARIDKITGGVT